MINKETLIENLLHISEMCSSQDASETTVDEIYVYVIDFLNQINTNGCEMIESVADCLETIKLICKTHKNLLEEELNLDELFLEINNYIQEHINILSNVKA